ncbi:MAG TPA: hypothetical protein ENK99_04155 [Campylobacterales bacterium]|nr:hypothetical protein [Campylobacterales bacterium]HHH50885.1 hypothetical protein [Campylobacterales bacterium]
MKLKEIANVIKGTHLKEKESDTKEHKIYKELTMLSLEPISFIDERKLIEVDSNKKVSSKNLTKVGDVIVSLYFPMIACFVEEGQEGLVIPHYMAVVRLKKGVKLDSRFIVQFINSTRGRKAICEKVSKLYTIRPTSLSLTYLNNVDILDKENVLLESF